VWRGIDNSKTTGRNSLVKFAIHILSIVVNSAACERVFSRFGITHTKRRCRLSLDKVRKTAIVKMDLQRSHIEAGLIHPQRKRKFSAISNDDATATGTTTSSVPTISTDTEVTEELEEGESDEEDDEHHGNEENIADFEELTEQLILAADEDDSNDEDNSAVMPTANNSSSTPTTSGPIIIRLPPRKTLIPLKDLFIYPEDSATPSDLEFYWKGGIAKLDETLAAYELLSQLQEGDSDE